MFKLVYNAFKYVYNIPLALARFNKRIIMLHLFRTMESMEHSTPEHPELHGGCQALSDRRQGYQDGG